MLSMPKMTKAASLKSKDVTLHQRQFLKGQQSFSFADGDALLVRVKNFQRTEEFTVPLGNLSPTTMLLQHSAFGFLVMAAICFSAFAAICIAIFAEMRSDSLGNRLGVSVLPTIFLFLPALTCLIRFFQRRCDLLLVRSRLDGSVILALWRNNPNASEFEAFTSELARRITLCPFPEVPPSQTLGNEIFQLEALRQKGILTSDEFAALSKLDL